MKRVAILLNIGLIVSLVLGSIACCGGAKQMTVSVDSPQYVDAGTDFSVKVIITDVKELGSFNFDVTYDSTVIRLVGEEAGSQGVTGGFVGTTSIPIKQWGFSPTGKQGIARVLGSVPGVGGATGSGYIAEIHFHVVGSAGMTSEINLKNGDLADVWEKNIAGVNWTGGSVHVVAIAPTPTPVTTPTPTSAPTATPAPTTTPITTPLVTATPPPMETPARPPSRFLGTVRLNGAPVGNDTEITAIVIADKGYVYSAEHGNSTYRIVISKPVGISYQGKTVRFMINGYYANESSIWEEGENKTVNLTASSAP